MLRPRILMPERKLRLPRTQYFMRQRLRKLGVRPEQLRSLRQCLPKPNLLEWHLCSVPVRLDRLRQQLLPSRPMLRFYLLCFRTNLLRRTVRDARSAPRWVFMVRSVSSNRDRVHLSSRPNLQVYLCGRIMQRGLVLPTHRTDLSSRSHPLRNQMRESHNRCVELWSMRGFVRVRDELLRRYVLEPKQRSPELRQLRRHLLAVLLERKLRGERRVPNSRPELLPNDSARL